MNTRQPGRLPVLLFALAALLLSPQLDASRALASEASSAPSYLETRIGASEIEGRDLVRALGTLSAEERSGYAVSSGGSAAGEHLAVLVHNGGISRIRRGASITLKRLKGWNRNAFARKAEALRDLAERGKLFRAPSPIVRDVAITGKYKSDLIELAYRVHGKGAKFERLRERILSLHADHLQDLQLLGPDVATNLGLLDPTVNVGLGRQVRKQVRGLEAFTPITRVRIKY